MAKWWGANLVWDGAFCRVQRDGYEICFVPDAGVPLDENDDVDLWVIFDGGERWSGTIYTLDNVRRTLSGAVTTEVSSVTLVHKTRMTDPFVPKQLAWAGDQGPV